MSLVSSEWRRAHRSLRQAEHAVRADAIDRVSTPFPLCPSKPHQYDSLGRSDESALRHVGPASQWLHINIHILMRTVV